MACRFARLARGIRLHLTTEKHGMFGFRLHVDKWEKQWKLKLSWGAFDKGRIFFAIGAMGGGAMANRDSRGSGLLRVFVLGRWKLFFVILTSWQPAGILMNCVLDMRSCLCDT